MTPKQSPAFWVVVLGTALAALGRLTVPGRPFAAFSWNLSYEALAHLWAGGLIGAGVVLWLVARERLDPHALWKPALLSALALVAFEVAAFAVGYLTR